MGQEKNDTGMGGDGDAARRGKTTEGRGHLSSPYGLRRDKEVGSQRSEVRKQRAIGIAFNSLVRGSHNL